MDADERPVPSSPGSTKVEPSSSSVAASNQASNAKLRKRTKTGCLTCRRRRIKCGEERPTCTNCVRSKRQCEGYNQRIIFKPTIEGWPGMMGPANIIPHHTSSLPGHQRPQDYHPEYAYVERHTHYGIPIDEYGHPIAIPPHQMGSPAWPTPQYPLPHFAPLGSALSPNGTHSIPPTPTSLSLVAQQGRHLAIAPMHSPGPLISPYYQQSPNFPQSFDHLSPQSHQPPTPHELHHASMGHALPTPATSTYTDVSGGYSNHGPDNPSGYFTSHTGQSASNAEYIPLSQTIQVQPDLQEVFEQKPGISRNFTGAPIAVHSMVPPARTQYIIAPNPYDLNTAAVEWQHEGYTSPWNSEEDVELSPEKSLVQMQRNRENLKMVMELHRSNAGDTSIRDYNTFLYTGFLTEYDAEKFASPLRNQHTARVFAHFLASTAPSISIFERKPQNPSPLFDDRLSQDYDHGTWTYTLPVMALNHQGLLHAMLSLSSLHISKLQNDAPTPAFKHYGYAIKRINRCVQHPDKRHNLTTLAATLLLGFYEVMTADHSKWCCHLTGAARLLQEINFREMAMQARAIQAQQSPRMKRESSTPGSRTSNIGPDALDDDFLERIVGSKIEYLSHSVPPTENFDMQKYHLYQDLFWWYARQDVYQSIIAGNRLMLKYHRWPDCPPRAPIGRPDALYGTHDHLFLLLGRIADFSSKDRARKLKVMNMNGGPWRPHPDMNMPPRPQPGFAQSSRPQPAPRTNGSAGTGAAVTPQEKPAMPNFFGMAPMPTNVAKPTSYFTNTTTPPHESPTSDKSDYDLETQTQLAVAEWNQMYATLNEMESHFGPGMKPLDPELYPFSSPFGPPIMYTSYNISVIWALYYAAHIVALRGHPFMPPFAHVAAAIAAPQTSEYSNIIGRIAAGMMTESVRHPLNPSVGATYCEVAMPLFIAGIQYTDLAQREWVVARTHEVEELTGWASVGMIGQGCERAWIKAAAAGMGPPYTLRESPTRVVDSSMMRVPRLARERPPEDGHWIDSGENGDPRGRRVHLAMGLLSNEKDFNAEEEAVRHEKNMGRNELDPLLGSSPSPLAYRPAVMQ